MILLKKTSKHSKVPIDELVILLPLIVTIDAGVDEEEKNEKEANNISPSHLNPRGGHIDSLITDCLEFHDLNLI